MRISITIDLGNDAMQTPRDVSDAIAESMMQQGYEHEPFKFGDYATIRDYNGNTVGTWTVQKDPAQ